ncbi:hypothetical protein IMZ31_19540 (plasmid) [Pontibacillus sp. ALD_SL1]|uniref:hypothetical protein n=1 Tax=Pontibacillus sp. ALD_SL1 TaxID=2777185 RepID=UPI001A9592D2|nr:hypothetical protein [Pontibacillus sp. ALD_SL1]QST02745.1 hypothetical protein IMZ31_19540 [Pontibacillus sp. ALD_SL1]
MKTIESDFVVKGRKHGNDYYIMRNEDETYNVYQVYCETNMDCDAGVIKKILPSLKHVDDEEIRVRIKGEKYPAFLMLYRQSGIGMNGFRMTLDREWILVNEDYPHTVNHEE